MLCNDFDFQILKIIADLIIYYGNCLFPKQMFSTDIHQNTINPTLLFKGMLWRNIGHFLKKCIHEKLGISEMK